MRQALPISISLALIASATDSETARAYDEEAFVAKQGKALVVFIQNEKIDRKMVFTVFGSEKRCIAEVGGREAQVLPLEPGAYIFYVLGYHRTRRIELYTAAGRTYFVRLHTVERPMGQVPEVTLVRRASEEHMALKFHLDDAFVTHALGDDKCYGKPLDERKNRTQRRLNEANADWKNGDDAYRDNYTLIERDGLTRADLELF